MKASSEQAQRQLAKYAATDNALSNKDVEKISNALYETGYFPAGLDACFVNGTMGRCGEKCTVFGTKPECMERSGSGE